MVATPGTAGGTPAGPDVISGIALGPDTTATRYTFAGTRPATLAGAVVDDGGAGVPGVAVTVNGRTPVGVPVERTARTGPDGIWTVPDLPAGIYTALVPQPPGYGDGPDTRGSAGGTPSEPNTISRIPLVGGQQASGYTFGLTRASISGNVFVDLDGDGDRGPANPASAGWRSPSRAPTPQAQPSSADAGRRLRHRAERGRGRRGLRLPGTHRGIGSGDPQNHRRHRPHRWRALDGPPLGAGLRRLTVRRRAGVTGP